MERRTRAIAFAAEQITPPYLPLRSRAIWTVFAGGAFAVAAIVGSGSAPILAQQNNPNPPGPTSAPAAVPDGTHFLVRLDDELRTDKTRVNMKFKVKTLEPLTTADGQVLPPGAEIRGHVSRYQPASITGRARLWLTFDDIKTPWGTRPIVADVRGVPGDHSVREGESKEGEIEARTSKDKQDIEAAAAGATIGAVAGGAARGGKGAAIGAAIGAVAGFLVSSGMGQELDLPKGTKLELELTRPLHLARE
jgi:hypothetical protein